MKDFLLDSPKRKDPTPLLPGLALALDADEWPRKGGLNDNLSGILGLEDVRFEIESDEIEFDRGTKFDVLNFVLELPIGADFVSGILFLEIGNFFSLSTKFDLVSGMFEFCFFVTFLAGGFVLGFGGLLLSLSSEDELCWSLSVR